MNILLTPKEVGELFGVGAKTVNRWAKAGRLTSQRTLGGHRRYFLSEVEELLARGVEERSGEPAPKRSA